MKIALALIVKPSAEEAKLLRRCLTNMTASGAIDGVFITQAGKSPHKNVSRVCKEFGAVESFFEWVDDFAAARNFNFAQVPKEYDYVLWTDADDVWRGLEKLKDTLAANPHMDAFGFQYLYEFDEFKKPVVVHRKTMLIKNDGCAVWMGRLHEDLQETRQLEVYMVDGIERLHLTTSERSSDNAKRNLAIAAKEAEENPEDPRAFWNLANSQFGVSEYEGALSSFTRFLKDSESDDEKYLAYERLADVYKSLDNRDEAIRNLQLAIGLRPNLPDAYFQLANLFYQYQNLDKAEEYCLQGLLRRPQPNRMIVFNPRDYDYNPMMLLARIYYDKNRPDLMLPLLKGCLKIYPDDKHIQTLVKEGEVEVEALRKALEQVKELESITDDEELKKRLDKLPEDIKSHPAICVVRNKRFIKKESSGKDLVIYCGQTTHQWNPKLFREKGFGGSEEAVIHMARQLAKLGWDVTVYNNCGHKPVRDVEGEMMDGQSGNDIVYRPFWEFNYRDKQDVVILWRWVKPLDAEINAPKVFVDLHDVVPAGEFTEKRLERVTKVFVKTKFHRSLFPTIPDEKIAVIPNGMELELDPAIKRDPLLVINTSSPDRSMDVLPTLWKRVKEQVPDAKFQWAYGWDVFKASHGNNQKMMAWMRDTIKAMDEAGIEQLGKLPQHEVAKLYQRASFLAYPTEFAEIDCISVKKAQAAGCFPVATDFGALKESIKYGIKVHSKKTKENWNRPYQFHFGLEDTDAQDQWVAAMVSVLEDGDIEGSVWDGKEEWVQKFSWEHIAKQWHKILSA